MRGRSEALPLERSKLESPSPTFTSACGHLSILGSFLYTSPPHMVWFPDNLLPKSSLRIFASLWSNKLYVSPGLQLSFPPRGGWLHSPALICSGKQDPMKAEAEGRGAFLGRDSFAGCCCKYKYQDGDEDEHIKFWGSQWIINFCRLQEDRKDWDIITIKGLGKNNFFSIILNSCIILMKK